jgi:hypothetical protein
MSEDVRENVQLFVLTVRAGLDTRTLGAGVQEDRANSTALLSGFFRTAMVPTCKWYACMRLCRQFYPIRQESLSLSS